MPAIGSDLDSLESNIGRVAVLWNAIHFNVYAMFAFMLRDPLRAEAIFFAIRTDRAQRDMTAALARDCLFLNEPLRDQVASTMAAIGSLAGRRNGVIHGMWSVSAPSWSPVIFAPSSPRLSGKDINREFQKLIGDLVDMREDTTTLAGSVLREVKETDIWLNARKTQPEEAASEPKSGGSSNSEEHNPEDRS